MRGRTASRPGAGSWRAVARTEGSGHLPVSVEHSSNPAPKHVQQSWGISQQQTAVAMVVWLRKRRRVELLPRSAFSSTVTSLIAVPGGRRLISETVGNVGVHSGYCAVEVAD